MYPPQTLYTRIDQVNTNLPSNQLYEPLRKSLLKTNLSQSNISSRSFLSTSKINDLSSSRVSRRMKSLSPQQAQRIKSNLFIPINKRLVPTNDINVIRNKRFEAINVQQKVYRPIPEIRFNTVNRLQSNKVQEIVYKAEAQDLYHNQVQYTQNQFCTSNVSSFPIRERSPPMMIRGNVYTTRVNSSSQVHPMSQRQYTPRQAYEMGLNARQLNSYQHSVSPVPPENYNLQTNISATGGFRNSNQPAPIQPLTRRSYRQSNGMIQKPIQFVPISSQMQWPKNPSNLLSLPTQHSLPLTNIVNPTSRTSFQLQRMNSQVSGISRGYDFSKLSSVGGSQTSSQYKEKKKQDFKYNLFSIFDEPANTKCQKVGCMKNQLFASKPKTYEWQQDY